LKKRAKFRKATALLNQPAPQVGFTQPQRERGVAGAACLESGAQSRFHRVSRVVHSLGEAPYVRLDLWKCPARFEL